MAFPIHSLERNPHGRHVLAAPAPAPSPAAAQTAANEAPSFSVAFLAASAANMAVGAAKTSAAAATVPAPSTPPPTLIGATTAPATAPATAIAGAASPLPSAGSPSADQPAGPLFGADPWVADPTGNGPNGEVTHYNQIYFATQQTAQTVAQMLGGTVAQSNQIITAAGSPFSQNQSNYMVQLPGGGMVNPGLIADIYTHGWTQPFIDRNVANEVAGANAMAASTNS